MTFVPDSCDMIQLSATACFTFDDWDERIESVERIEGNEMLSGIYITRHWTYAHICDKNDMMYKNVYDATKCSITPLHHVPVSDVNKRGMRLFDNVEKKNNDNYDNNNKIKRLTSSFLNGIYQTQASISWIIS